MLLSLGMSIKPNITEVAVACGVSRTFVLKMENDFLTEKLTILWSVPKRKRSHGSFTLGAANYRLIIELYREEPSRTIGSYVVHWELLNGTHVSHTMVTCVLEKAFPFKGKL